MCPEVDSRASDNTTDFFFAYSDQVQKINTSCDFTKFRKLLLQVNSMNIGLPSFAVIHSDYSTPKNSP